MMGDWDEKKNLNMYIHGVGLMPPKRHKNVRCTHILVCEENSKEQQTLKQRETQTRSYIQRIVNACAQTQDRFTLSAHYLGGGIGQNQTHYSHWRKKKETKTHSGP